MKIFSIFTTLCVSLFFLFPVGVHAQVDPLGPEPIPTDLQIPGGLPSGGAGTSDNLLSDVAGRALSLGVCSGGTLSDRLEEVAGAGIEGALNFGAEKFQELVGGDAEGFIQNVLGTTLEVGVPVLGGLISGALGLGGNDGPQEVLEPDLRAKDHCLDALANASAKQVLQYVANGTVDWIQAGDDGNPLFVIDLERRLATVADQAFNEVVGEVIGGTVYENVCDAFEHDVVSAIWNDYYRENPGASYEIPAGVQEVLGGDTGERCGLEELINERGGDIDSFIEGNFQEGGWAAWRALAQNNPYRASLDAQIALQDRIAQRQDEERIQFQSSGGFAPDRRCADNDGEVVMQATAGGGYQWIDNVTRIPLGTVLNTDGQPYRGGSNETAENPPCINETVVTPGSVVATIVNDIIGSDVRRAELADEFNEIIADAGDLLVSKVQEQGLLTTGKGDVTGLNSLASRIRNLKAAIQGSILQYEEANDAVSRMSDALRRDPLSSNSTTNTLNQYYDPSVTGQIVSSETPSFLSPQTPEELIDSAEACNILTNEIADVRSYQSQIAGDTTSTALLEDMLARITEEQEKSSPDVEVIAAIESEYRDFINSSGVSVIPIDEAQRIFVPGMDLLDDIEDAIANSNCDVTAPSVEIFVGDTEEDRSKTQTASEGVRVVPGGIFTLGWDINNISSTGVCEFAIDGASSLTTQGERIEDGSEPSGFEGSVEVEVDFTDITVELTCETRPFEEPDQVSDSVRLYTGEEL